MGAVSLQIMTKAVITKLIFLLLFNFFGFSQGGNGQANFHSLRFYPFKLHSHLNNLLTNRQSKVQQMLMNNLKLKRNFVDASGLQNDKQLTRFSRSDFPQGRGTRWISI